jgi:DNA-binding transcriptional MocR family regulator
MEKHAALLRPKFELAEEMLHTRLSPTGAARWFIPDGGYFFAVDTLENCAKKTEALCKEAGVVITDAGAAYPYSNDPHDRNLRIALSYLSMDEAEHALHVLCAAINLSALMKLLGD